MTPNCLQNLDNGQRCSAPALNGSKFCRHHDPRRPPRSVCAESPDTNPLLLPRILDKQSALVALNEVVQALAEGRIPCSLAQTMLSAIRFAARLINEIEAAGEVVQPVAGESRPGTIALAASGSPRRVTESVPKSSLFRPHPAEVDPSTDRLVKELLAQSHEWSKVQKPGINSL